jgi:hypothetical protein
MVDGTPLRARGFPLVWLPPSRNSNNAADSPERCRAFSSKTSGEYPLAGRRFSTLCYRFDSRSELDARADLVAALRNAQPRPASSNVSTALLSRYGLASAETANANYATFAHDTVLAIGPGGTCAGLVSSQPQAAEQTK